MALHVSATKLQFMHALNLDPNIETHRQVYVKMLVGYPRIKSTLVES